MITESKRRVLFLCTGNSCRSQMAEGLVNHFLGDEWIAFSAGTKPEVEANPLAIRALYDLGIDGDNLTPKSLAAFHGQDFDLIITLCDSAAKECPVWFGKGQLLHRGFPDPADATGTEEEQYSVYVQVRDAIRETILPLLQSHRIEWSSPQTVDRL